MLFTDIHCHIVPSIDDGAECIDTTNDMLDIAREDGIENIIATPHFIYGEINNTMQHINDSAESAIKLAADKGIQLYCGSELFICPQLCSLVDEGVAATLNNSRYVLVEFPMMSIPEYTKDILFSLQLQGYVPIIAHPERNRIIQDKPNILLSFVERGILTQINATSINRIYGSKVQKVAFELIGQGLAHFVASDAHTTRNRAPRLSKAYDEICKKFDQDVADNLFCYNGKAVIYNREIAAEITKHTKKKTIFSYFF